jgi:hypothetical protein
LPPAFSSKVIPGGQMQVLNMQQITWISHRPPKIDDGNAPASILDCKNCLHVNGNLGSPMKS